MSRTRSMGAAWLRLLAQSATPLYALDELRQIQYVNPAAASWLELEIDDLLERRCDFHAPAAGPTSSLEAGRDLTAVVAALCPPPDALAGRRSSFPLNVPLRDGRETRRWGELVPLAGTSAGERAGYVVFVGTEERATADKATIDGVARDDHSPESLHRRLQALRRTWWGRFHLDRLLGESPAMQRVREQVRWAADSPVRVVVAGPAGSGREFVARAIHRGLQSSVGPLVVWECPLFDLDLFRRSLDALSRLKMDGGSGVPSLLLRDVDQLPVDVQHALADHVRSWRQPPRTLATAGESLTQLARDGKFQEELAAWLSTCEIHIPPLHRRIEDIPWLAQAFLEEQNARGNRQWAGFSNEAMEWLVSYRWPGQAAELDKIIQESCRRAEGPFVQASDLPTLLRHAAEATRPARRVDESLRLDEFLSDMEREVLRRALTVAKGNKAKAARSLGISRPRLLRRLEQLGVEYP